MRIVPRITLVCVALAAARAAEAQAAGSVRRLDAALDKLIPTGATVEKVIGNLQFAEGPVWVRAGGYLQFSDIPANAIMMWSAGGELSVFRKPVFARDFPSGIQIGSNGLTLDRQGRLIACEHGNRRVSRTEKDGTSLRWRRAMMASASTVRMT